MDGSQPHGDATLSASRLLLAGTSSTLVSFLSGTLFFLLLPFSCEWWKPTLSSIYLIDHGENFYTPSLRSVILASIIHWPTRKNNNLWKRTPLFNHPSCDALWHLLTYLSLDLFCSSGVLSVVPHVDRINHQVDGCSSLFWIALLQMVSIHPPSPTSKNIVECVCTMKGFWMMKIFNSQFPPKGQCLRYSTASSILLRKI